MTDTVGVPGRTRPLCDYPKWARYNGTGDVNLAASFTCVEREDVPATQRQTVFGTVVGTDNSATSGTYAWKGVPFAAAPVGDLRWKPPVDPAPWTSPKYTQQFGNACVQSGRLYGPGLNNKYDATIGTSLGQTVGSEDCLYLNIWRPAGAATQLPVIVWVHGGSNISGYTADPMYDGAHLARTANAIVVSVNYRLGVFGFLNMAPLKTGEAQNDSGDFAILDIVKALKFVNANVAAFGGDPAKVTLMGQSAGAVDVYAVMVSPLVVNANPSLVHRLLPISGGLSLAGELPAGSIATLAPASAYAGQAAFLLAQLVIGDGLATDVTSANAYIATQTNAQLATYLRGKSADAILTTVLTKLAPIGASGSGPIPDGTVVPTSAIAAIQAGQALKVPILAGNTRDEGKLFPTLFGARRRHRQRPTAQRRDGVLDGVQLQPERRAAVDARAVDPAGVPADVDAGHRLHRGRRQAQRHLLPRQPRQRAQRGEDAAEQHLVLPLRLGRAAGAVQRDLRRGARLRPAVRVRQLRAFAVRQHLVHDGQRARPAGAVRRDDAQHRRVRPQRRSEQRQPRRHLAGVAGDAGVRRHADGQGDLGAVGERAPGSPPRSALTRGDARRPRAAAQGRRAQSGRAGGAPAHHAEPGEQVRARRAGPRRDAAACLAERAGQADRGARSVAAEPRAIPARTEAQVERKGPVPRSRLGSSCGNRIQSSR